MVVHAAAKQLSSTLAGQVAAVVCYILSRPVPCVYGFTAEANAVCQVLFGDPLNGSGVQGIPATKVKTFCHTDDSVCKGSPVISNGHLTYSSDAPAAASFVAQQIGT